MLKTYKPTTPSRRSKKTLIRDIDKVRPHKASRVALVGPAGRSGGKISTRHRQRGARVFYRVLDFRRQKLDIPAKVQSIEYDPNRGPNIALLVYADGEKRYILAPQGLERNSTVISGPKAPISVGNALPLSEIPLGTHVHNVEINPRAGGVMVRSGGSYATVMAKEGNKVSLRLPSGETKLVLSSCYATIGELSGEETRNVRLGKAGTKRHKGWRPEVRGVAMGAYAHPHGGSYADTGVGMPSPKTPWGKKARGVKTRRRVRTNRTIISGRSKKGK